MSIESFSATRRQLLQAMAGGAGLLLAPRSGIATTTVTDMRTIAASGETIPAVGMGTWRTFSMRQQASSLAVLTRFVELGGKVIDSSPMYGDAETAIGALAGQIDALQKLFVASKVWTNGLKAGQAQIRRSVERLGKTPLDLMQVHNLVDWRTQLNTLRAMKDRGEVRYIGITHYVTSAHEQMARIVETQPIDFIQVNYNIATPAAEQRLLPLAADRGVSVIINRPYAEGSLFSRVRNATLPAWAAEFDCTSFGQFFLKFILSNPAVTCVIPATTKVHHLEDNMGAGAGRLPDTATRQRMRDWFDAL